MRQGSKTRFYLLVAGCLLAAAVYYLTVTLPLIREERDLDARIADAVDTLALAGHGMSTGEVDGKIERLQADIAAFEKIGGDPARTIRFAPEVEELLGRPFQLFDFDRRKFIVVHRLRGLSQEHKVSLFENWEQTLPSYSSQAPYDLWAQLTVMDQLLRTAIGAGVASIDGVELVLPASNPAMAGAEQQTGEVSVRMQLTGPMAAIHSVIMMLPLNGEELKALGITGMAEPKSSFFLSRFILKKSSPEKADEVKLDVVVSGFLDADRHL